MHSRPQSFHMNQSIFSAHESLGKWYNPILLNPATLFHRAQRPTTMQRVLDVLDVLTPDDYAVYVSRFYREGMEKFAPDWCYLDILTVLCAAAELIRPQNYLEIGVRRGRSLAVVLSRSPATNCFGFDMWKENYAGMKNPGSAFVEEELRGIGHTGTLEFIDGNSHQTLKVFLKKFPGLLFDLITVDGDHSDKGAYEDLRDVLPRVAPGGTVVFDDISHPEHPNLANVWAKAIKDSKLPFKEARYADLGYGIAVAVRQ